MKRQIPLVLTVVFAVLVASCGAKAAKPAVAAPEKSQTIFAVNTVQAVAGTLENYLRVNADVRNSSSVDVVPETAGKVVSLAVDLGSVVKKGDIVAEVDPSRPGMQFVVSPVRAPISGTVVSVPASIGATVSTVNPIIRISRSAEMRLVANIAEKDISSIHKGLLGLVEFEAYPGLTFQAHVVEVSPEVDPVSRTLEIKLLLDQPDTRIKVGMFARVKLITDSMTDVVKIPAEAVVQRLGANYVFVSKEDHSVELRKVTLGLNVDGKQQILGGLKAGEIVVIRGQTLLDDGAKINVIQQVPALSVKDSVE